MTSPACTDCAYMLRDRKEQRPRCYSPHTRKMGTNTYPGNPCNVERADGPCGEYGLFFERKDGV